MAKTDDPFVRTLFTLPQSVVDILKEYVSISGHRSKSNLVAASIREYIKPYEKRRLRAIKLMKNRGMAEKDIATVIDLIDH